MARNNRIDSKTKPFFWREKDCECPIVPNERGHRMISTQCQLHYDYGNCVIVTHAPGRLYFGDPGLYGEPGQQTEYLKAHPYWRTKLCDESEDSGAIKALQAVLKRISEAREKDLRGYTDSMGDRAYEDREARGLAHGYASAWLIVNAEIGALRFFDGVEREMGRKK